MIRNILAGAAAAVTLTAFWAGSAFAADSIRISLAGKTPAEIHAAIVKAASDVCYAQTKHEPLFAQVYSACVSQTVAVATAKAGALQPAAYAGR